MLKFVFIKGNLITPNYKKTSMLTCTSEELTVWKQCAAVSTWEGDIKDPPQNGCIFVCPVFALTNAIWNSYSSEDQFFIKLN